MSEEIEISDDIAVAINELGGTFDTVDDVLRRLVHEAGHGNLLEDEGAVEKTEWTAEDFLGFFENTDSTSQQVFLTMLVTDGDEDGWVPKDEILERLEAEGVSIENHTLDGVQSSMTRRCRSRGLDKFWERQGGTGSREYRILPEHQEQVAELWNPE